MRLSDRSLVHDTYSRQWRIMMGFWGFNPPHPEIVCWYGIHTNSFNQRINKNPTAQHGIKQK